MSLEGLEQLEKDLRRITSTSMGRRVFLSALPALLAGCATSSKTQHRYREGDNKGQETSMSVSDEKKVARDYAVKLEKEYVPVKDREMQRYIQGLGQRLVRDSHLNGNPYDYEFKFVEAKMVNAFALPAGRIYVTRPLLKFSQSEAELAGVIGHEIGHVKARHSAERMEKAKKGRGKTLLIGLGGALLGGVAGYGLGRLLCSKEDRECLGRIAKYGALAGGAGGLLISKFGFMANSREDEMEADRVGFRIAYQSGFHRDYVGKFYWRLQEMESKHKRNNALMSYIADAMSTHPPSKERIIQMRQMMGSVPIRGKVISSRAYEKIMRRNT